MYTNSGRTLQPPAVTSAQRNAFKVEPSVCSDMIIINLHRFKSYCTMNPYKIKSGGEILLEKNM